jgi:uncharacterized protein YbaR (Trm112 family)
MNFMAYCQITILPRITMLPLEFLQILACPTCKGELAKKDNGSCLRCNVCGIEYPIVDGIPVLLPQTPRNSEVP